LYKKYLQIILLILVIALCFISAMNYIIDPYGYNSKDNKFIKNLTMFNKPSVTNSRLNSDGYYYLIGSSRMARVNPKVIEEITNKKVHNIKIDGATLQENTLLALKVKEKNKFFIYSFDAFSINKNRLNFQEITNREKAYQSELDNKIFISKYYNSDITIRSIQHLIKALKGEDKNKQYLEENSRNSKFSFNQALTSSGISNSIGKSNFSNYETYQFEAVTKLAKLGTKNDIFIIFPKYVAYYAMFSEYQDIEKKYFSAIKELVENTKAQVWSYYGANDISLELNNFIDNGWHFKPQITNIIFKQVFESSGEALDNNLGVLITKENLNDYLLSTSNHIDNIIIDEN